MPYFFYQGKRCFYTCSGVGPPLLFLHGNTASSQMFQFLLPFYTPCFHCILLDFLGSGRSQRMPELPPQLWIDQGRQAAALIRHLGLGPVFLVGTSGGAWAALNAGLEHPDLVRGIVADSFDGRTLHRGFDRELLEERAAAKASHQARQFYQWCQGADWEEVVDRDTRSLVRCAREGLPLFSRPLEELQAPPTADGQPGGRHVPERSGGGIPAYSGDPAPGQDVPIRPWGASGAGLQRPGSG